KRAAKPSRRIHPPPDFVAIHEQLQSHKDLILEVLWQEYRKTEPGGCGYSRFCDLYREWSRGRNLTLRQQHTTWNPTPATSHVAVRISRTTRSCTFHIKGYETYQNGATAESDGTYDTRYSEKSPSVPYSHSLLRRAPRSVFSK